ncbi:MAG: hypothetical protein Q8P34_09115 [Bacteroidota bacterium]|nr:hypothetical protein [Bacteroidota bacterium]
MSFICIDISVELAEAKAEYIAFLRSSAVLQLNTNELTDGFVSSIESIPIKAGKDVESYF